MQNENPTVSPAPLLGAHFSIAKGLHHAVYTAQDYNCTALQIFTKNASTWKERFLDSGDIDRFTQAKIDTGIDCIAAHTAYLINIASPEAEKRQMSLNALRQELIRSTQLGVAYTVLHPGAHMGDGEEVATRRVADVINTVFSETPGIQSRLLLETTAGQGSGIGHTFEQIAGILRQVKRQDLIGVCVDTAHIFAAGYDIRDPKSYEKTLVAFDRAIGLPYLYLIHLNDSKKSLGSHVDRHEHIGQGAIGLTAFELVMNDPRLATIPKIIETPKKDAIDDWDRSNLDTLRHLIHPTAV